MKKFNLFSVIAMVFALTLSVSFVSCDKNGDDPTPDDGKIDPSTIAKDNLIAYFPFEGDGVEKINNLAPSNAATTKVTFTTGRRGKGFQGNSDGLKSGLLYKLPAGNKLKSLQAFSFSLWLKMVPNTLETKDVPEQMVFQLDGTGDWVWGNLFLLQHRNWPEGSSDRDKNFAQMDCYFWKDDSKAWKGQRGNDWFINVSEPQWRHVTCTYDNKTSEFHAYVNGVHVTKFDGTEYGGVSRKQSEDGPALGDLKFKDAENLAIGAWSERLKGASLLTDEWAAPYKGQMDEFRIYNRSLTKEEVKALYDAEITQIN